MLRSVIALVLLAVPNCVSAQTATWEPTGAMRTPRSGHSATLLPSGKVLVTGGYNGNLVNSAEIYDPTTGKWEDASSPAGLSRTSRAIALPSGEILVLNNDTAEIYDTKEDSWKLTTSPAQRRSFSLTPLASGEVVVGGGLSASSSSSSLEMFNRDTESWSSRGSFIKSRSSHSATLLPSGELLIAGGWNSEEGYLGGTEICDPIAGQCRNTGSLNEQRRDHSAILLPSGKVLAVGGIFNGRPIASCEIFDSESGTWTTTTELNVARAHQTMDLLSAGDVLVVGGFGGEATAEIFDPQSESWTMLDNLSISRFNHTATLLPSGQILVVGGLAPDAISSAEILRLDQSAWRETDPLNTPRAWHTATLLQSGRVLVSGGSYPLDTTPLTSSEVYDPETETWEVTGPLNSPRSFHTATLLTNGEVFVVGGSGLGGAEIYEPLAEAWRNVEPPHTARYWHSSTLLASGKVLVLGGRSERLLGTAEIYDPSLDAWSFVTPMQQPRGRHTATLLPSGKVLVAGGTAGGFTESTEIYDPMRDSWETVGSLSVARGDHAATLLRTGEVLVSHGTSFIDLTRTEIFDPKIGVWTPTAPSTVRRTDPAVTVLASGTALVSGGNRGVAQATAEIYEPATDRWAATANLNQARGFHTATSLPNGEVLVVGGFGSAFLSSAELYSPQTHSERATPIIKSATATIRYGETFSVKLEGCRNAPSNDNTLCSHFPIIDIHSLDNSIQHTLTPDNPSLLLSEELTLSFSDLPSSLLPGTYYLTATVAGIRSEPHFTKVECSIGITRQPQDQLVNLNKTATFRVESQGGRQVQWFRDNIPIPDAVDPTYTTGLVEPADAGATFHAVVDSGCTSTSSATATLEVVDTKAPSVEVIYPNGGEYIALSSPEQGPNQSIISWEMADNIRTCQVRVELLYSNDGGASYTEAPAGGGLPAVLESGACKYPGELRKSLQYSVPSEPPSGTSGSLYKIRVVVTDRSGNTGYAESGKPFFMVQPSSESVRTIILSHPTRLASASFSSDQERDQLQTKLRELANHPNVQGLVVDLGGVTELQDLYSAWDANPALANQVLFGCHGNPLPAGCNAERRGIHDVVQNLLEIYGSVENLILVGDDRIIPMARITDRTDLFPESHYTSDDPANLQAELSTQGTSVGRALAAELYLSDDPLATRGQIELEELREEGHTFLPQLGVGRLVETPAEIIAAIATFISRDGVLDLESVGPNKVQITAYDFLVDAGKKIHQRWLTTLGSADLLSGQTWAEDDLITRLCTLDGVANLNGHATHFEEGVPGSGVFDIHGLDTVEMLAPNACGEHRLELNGRVIYAVGCHGGLPVAGSTVPTDPELDLPQAFLSRGVMAYLANSGYAWGLRWGVGYSERLVELFTEELTRGGTVILGEAVKNAKLRYFMESPRFDAYSEKTLMQWTFYGFPIYSIKTGIPEEPEPDALLQPVAKQRAALEKLGAVTVERREVSRSVAAKVELPDYLTQVNLRFNLSAVGVYEKYQASGDPEPAPGCTDPNGCYYRLNGLVEWETGTADLPLQPFLVYDSRLSGTSQHGVLWMGGAYDVEHDFPPVFAELISNGGDGSDPGVLPRKIYRKPRWPRRRLFGGNRDCRATDNEVSSIVLTTGESVLGPDGTFSIQRLYRDIDLEAFYFNNPQDPQQNCDRIGPVLGGGPHHQASGTQIDWAVTPTDPSGIWRVVAVYDDEAQQRWVPVELSDDGNGTWRGHAIMGNAGTVSYFLQAVDQRGNVSWLDYESPRPPASAAPLGLPLPVDVPITPGDADLSVILVDSPDPVKPNELLVYTLFVENHGPDPASSIDVSQTLDSDLRFLDATGDGWDCDQLGQQITCSRESLGVGTSPAISISARAPSSTGTLASHASAAAVETDPDPTDNSTTQNTGVVEDALADIEVFKTGRAIPGSANEIRYTITVTNHGPESVTGVTVIDQFPSQILPATVLWTCQASTGAACSAGGNGHIQDSGVALPAGGRVQYDATANAAPGFSGIVESSASVSLPGFVVDENLENNQSSVTISLPPPSPEIFADGFETGSFLAWSSMVSEANLVYRVRPLRLIESHGENHSGQLDLDFQSWKLAESELGILIVVDPSNRNPLLAVGIQSKGNDYVVSMRPLAEGTPSTEISRTELEGGAHFLRIAWRQPAHTNAPSELSAVQLDETHLIF